MKFMITLLPAVFMMIIAVISLCFILQPWFYAVFFQGIISVDPMVITSIILLFLAFFLAIEAVRIFVNPSRKAIAEQD